MFKKVVLSLVAILGIAFTANAQKTVSGTVSDADGIPLPGVAVIVAGTHTGTVSNAEGHYSIPVAEGKTLEFSAIGMSTQSIVVGKDSKINVRMTEDVLSLDEVVVTALGISKTEKSLGYSATTLKNEELTAARGDNAIKAIAGKVAGVQVSSTSTTAGGAPNIIVRGIGSLGSSNQPLYVVDGIPLQSASLYTTAASYANVGSGVGSINADDIESMTILKGAAATALYGSRAAGGVILINTKSGKNKTRTEITVNAGVQFSDVSTLPEFQNKWGTGWDGSLTLNENGSWGAPFNGQIRQYGPVVDNSQMIKAYAAVPNNIRNFYDTGVQYNTSVALQGGNERTGYYFSYSNISDDGILPRDKDKYTKNTLSFHGNHKAYKWLALESSVNFSNQSTDQVNQGSQMNSMIEGLYQASRDISFIDCQDMSNIFNRPEGWYTPYKATNPYWLIENAYNHTDLKKLFGKIQADITPIDHLTLTYRYGFDYTDYDSKRTEAQVAMDSSYANSDSNYEGSISVGYGRLNETNHDFLANWTDKYFGGKLDVNLTAGANVNIRKSTSLGANVTGLTFDTGFWDLSNTTSDPQASESQWERRSVSAFGDFQVGWDDQVYLDITARNDWSSTLPAANRSFFYPGSTLSWLFTNTFDLSGTPVSFGKLRVAYGKTGTDPGVYMTNAVFVQGAAVNMYGTDLSFPFNGYNGYMQQASLASATLQPEMTTEFEVGTNILFFNNRIGLDLAYYNRTSDMQIFSLPVDPATGYSTMTMNFGKVNNKGIELLLTTTPIKTRDFQWDLDFNWSKNHNEVISLPEGLDGGKSALLTFDGVRMYAEVGKPIGELYTTLPQYTEDGHIIVNSDGLPVQGSDYEDTGFNVQNKWIGGISTSLRYKNFSVSATLDVRYGGKMYCRTKSLNWFTGNSLETAYNERRAFVVPNSVVSDGQGGYVENSTPIDLYSSTFQYYFDGNYSYPLEGGVCKLVDKTYAKLRDLAISYDLKTKLFEKAGIHAVKLSAVGSNLFLWTPKSNCYIDPDQGYTTDLGGMFGEIYCTVPCRYFGFNVQVKF